MTDKPVITSDPGYVELIDFMGNEQSVLKAARVSIGGQKPKSTDERLLRYLWKNKHTSPFEHTTYTFRIEAPIFVARQIMRHRTFSYNEISGRYAELDLGYYIPDVLFEQSSQNKQGTAEKPVLNQLLLHSMSHSIRSADLTYHDLLRDGVSREQARMILPVCTFTSFYMTGNLLNWLKFLSLRFTEEAQYETWWIAMQIADIIREGVPLIFDIAKEDIYGSEGLLAESRHFNRAIQEGRIVESSRETSGGTPAHGAEVPEIVRPEPEDGSEQG